VKSAIVLSTRTIGLGVIRALGIMGVPIIAVYYDKGDMGYLSKYVKEKVYAPYLEKAEDQFIDLLPYFDHFETFFNAILFSNRHQLNRQAVEG